MRVEGLDHAVLVVSDVERSVSWYRDLLAVEVERLEEWRDGGAAFVSLRIDPTTIIDLFQGAPEGGAISHLALVVTDVDLAEVASRDDLDVEMGPSALWGAQGEGSGVYLKDPDGNRVELRTYG